MILKNVKEMHFLTGRYEVLEPNLGHDCQRIELDLGCGKGGFSLELAARNPEILVLAADIKASRLRKINNKASVRKVTNLETLRVMAWELIAYFLPDNCLDRVHILNPDPWPKAKHSGNRMLSSEFLGRLQNVMKPDAVLHLSTDDVPYFEWTQKAIAPLTQFVEYPEGIDDVRGIQTEFEKIYASEGKPVQHLSYILKKDSTNI
jgi:tRNA (guanine-N7-)-methyltransferase